jgi:SUF system FeS cluster assembly, SufBD
MKSAHLTRAYQDWLGLDRTAGSPFHTTGVGLESLVDLTLPIVCDGDTPQKRIHASVVAHEKMKFSLADDGVIDGHHRLVLTGVSPAPLRIKPSKTWSIVHFYAMPHSVTEVVLELDGGGVFLEFEMLENSRIKFSTTGSGEARFLSIAASIQAGASLSIVDVWHGRNSWFGGDATLSTDSTLTLNQRLVAEDGYHQSSFQLTIPKGATNASIQQKTQVLKMHSKSVVEIHPWLLIGHNQVQASHGVAIGSYDSEALLYLTTRGISTPSAKNMLLKGFLHVVDR